MKPKYKKKKQNFFSHVTLIKVKFMAGVARDNDSPRLLTGGSVSCKGGVEIF